MSTPKSFNPKDSIGKTKWRQYTAVPSTVTWALGIAMLEGARKYGRHNYRVAPVEASAYIDAAKGHIDQWWEGENMDADSKLNHLVKAMASLAVLYDAIVMDTAVDDRPPRIDLDKYRDRMQEALDYLMERIPDSLPPFTQEQEKIREENEAQALVWDNSGIEETGWDRKTSDVVESGAGSSGHRFIDALK